MPVLRYKTCAYVFLERDVGVAFDGDFVIVIEENELAKLMCAGKRASLVRNPFFQTPVAAERVGVMVDNFVLGGVIPSGKMRFGERHTDGVRDALPQRSGRRFDACGVTVFWVSGGLGVELTEIHQIFFREPEPVEVEQRIIQHRPMPSRKNEAVTILPS